MQQKHLYNESIKRNGYTVINCNSCGYWHVDPMPADEKLNDYYEKEYYKLQKDNRTLTDKLKDEDDFYRIQYEDRLRHITRCFPAELPKTVLDIGAGYGDFLRFMKANGWDTQGLEPSKEAYGLIEDRESLNIKNATINELIELEFRSVSLATLNNVLEHLNNPGRLLDIVRKRLLATGGILFIVVPNDFNILQEVLMRSVLKDYQEKQYYWVSPPNHLNYWSPKTIKDFLGKCGFEILYFTTDFPMELFPLMGDDYITRPEAGKAAHLKRVSLEKHLSETNSSGFKDSLYSSLAQLGIGRVMNVIATASK